MKNIIKILAATFGLSMSSSCDMHKPFQVDYDELILLDAENLAEQGILEAYEELKPVLSKYVREVAVIEEVDDSDVPIYHIKFRGEELEIYGPNIGERDGESWGRATYILFHIVNSQLAESDTKFYALNGGNDLGGMFLSYSQYVDANKSIKREKDKFYIPSLEHPWYGQPH